MRREDTADARLLAYHEAGHTVAAFVLKRPFGSVALHPEDPATSAGPGKMPVTERSFDEIERDIIVLLAGVEAEAILTGYCDWFAAQADRERAEAMLAGMLAAGYRARVRDEREAELVSGLGDDAERAAWELLCSRAHELIHREPAPSAVAALAGALLARGTLTPDQAQRAIREGIASADPELQ